MVNSVPGGEETERKDPLCLYRTCCQCQVIALPTPNRHNRYTSTWGHLSVGTNPSCYINTLHFLQCGRAHYRDYCYWGNTPAHAMNRWSWSPTVFRYVVHVKLQYTKTEWQFPCRMLPRASHSLKWLAFFSCTPSHPHVKVNVIYRTSPPSSIAPCPVMMHSSPL